MWKVRINFGLRPNFGLSDRWDQTKKSTSLFADLRSQTVLWSQSLVSAKDNPKSEVTQCFGGGVGRIALWKQLFNIAIIDTSSYWSCGQLSLNLFAKLYSTIHFLCHVVQIQNHQYNVTGLRHVRSGMITLCIELLSNSLWLSWTTVFRKCIYYSRNVINSCCLSCRWAYFLCSTADTVAAVGL